MATIEQLITKSNADDCDGDELKNVVQQIYEAATAADTHNDGVRFLKFMGDQIYDLADLSLDQLGAITNSINLLQFQA